jgi:hypothetical protein
MVLAFFQLDKEQDLAIDRVWHAAPEPRLHRERGRRPVAQNRQVAARNATLATRAAIHKAARIWMSNECGGAFATKKRPQPLLDLLIFDTFGPSSAEPVDRKIIDALGAVGVDAQDFLQQGSERLKGLNLQAQDVRQVDPAPTWTLWGAADVIGTQIENPETWGSQLDQAIANIVDDSIKSPFTLIALSHFLEAMREDVSDLRDSASAQQKHIRKRALKRVRTNLLGASLDTASIAADVKEFSQPRSRHQQDAVFVRSLAPWVAKLDAEPGRPSVPPINVNEELRKQHLADTKELAKLDHEYRDILSTVASLGVSINSFTTQRIALIVSLLSLVISFVTLLVAVPAVAAAIGQLFADAFSR